MTHVSFAWPAFLMTASLAWNSGTPQAYLRTILPNLLDAHVFGYCGWNLDGTRSDGCVASPGKATKINICVSIDPILPTYSDLIQNNRFLLLRLESRQNSEGTC